MKLSEIRELKNIGVLLNGVCDTEKGIEVVTEGFHDNLLHNNFWPSSYFLSFYKFFGLNSIQWSLLNYVPYVLSRPTCLVPHVLSCP